MENNGLLLITKDTEGSVIGIFQSSQPDLGTITIVSSKSALKNALDEQKDGLCFYKIIYSYRMDAELIEAKKEFNVVDGTYKKIGNQIIKL